MEIKCVTVRLGRQWYIDGENWRELLSAAEVLRANADMESRQSTG